MSSRSGPASRSGPRAGRSSSGPSRPGDQRPGRVPVGRSRGSREQAGPGQRPDRLPGGSRRSPRPDDPDAQGHCGADDPVAGRAPRLRFDGGRCDEPRPAARVGQARLPGPRGPVAELRPVRRQGRRRGPPAAPGVQRQLDRWRVARQAARPCRRGSGGRRWPDRAGHPRRRRAVDRRPQPGHRGRRGTGPRRQASARRLRRWHVHDRQHRAGSARTSRCRSSTSPKWPS